MKNDSAISFPELDIDIEEMELTPVAKVMCINTGAHTFNELLHLLKNIEIRRHFGRKSRRQIRANARRFGVALNNLFQPYMKVVR